MHEQSAVHLADGYYRASGEPMLAFTSIGPGATNTVIGMATAYVDSTAVALFTGSPHTYMRGHGAAPGARAAPRRRQPAHLRAGRQGVVAAVARRRAAVRPAPRLERDDAPGARARSCWTCRWTSRPRRPRSSLPDLDAREARGRPRPDATAGRARPRALLAGAKRPVIVAGGGVIGAEATAELRGAGRAARGAGGDDLERQGRDRRDASAGRADDRRHRLDDRQRAGRVGRRAPERRLPVRRLVGVVVARGRDVRASRRRSSSSSRSTRARSARTTRSPCRCVGDARAGLARPARRARLGRAATELRRRDRRAARRLAGAGRGEVRLRRRRR